MKASLLNVRASRSWLAAVILMKCSQVFSDHLTLSVDPPFFGYSFSTLAGNPNTFGHKDGVGQEALFGETTGLAVDKAGNAYAVDPFLGGQTIRKITPDGVVTTFAGVSGQTGWKDGVGAAARFHEPYAIVADGEDNFYVADAYNNMIRKVTTAAIVSRLAGSGGQGNVDGHGDAAWFKYPTGIAWDRGRNLYVADQLNHTIRKVTLDGDVTTLAGMPGVQGNRDGVSEAARFSYPLSLGVAGDGSIYVADGTGLRRVTTTGLVTTPSIAACEPRVEFGGAASSFGNDSTGNLYLVAVQRGTITEITKEGCGTAMLDMTQQLVGFWFQNLGSAIAFDRWDNVYVADAGRSTILRSSAAKSVIPLTVVFTPDSFGADTASVVVESSFDLSIWTGIQTNSLIRFIPTKFFQTNSPSAPMKFFRARLEHPGTASTAR
jgi:sugar lactone lactonase YvrE